jgi:hypothetical protein
MTTNNTQQKNFLASLFDFGFTSFVTLRFLKVIYAIVVVVVLLAGLAFLIAGLSTARGASILFVIIFAPLVTLVYLIFVRVTFEIIAMFFRIGDNTFLAVQLLRGGNPGGQWNPGPQPGFGPPPQYGTQAFPGAPAPYNYGPSGNEPSTGPTAPTGPTFGAPQGNYGPPADGPRNPQGPSLEKPPSSPGSTGWDPAPPNR